MLSRLGKNMKKKYASLVVLSTRPYKRLLFCSLVCIQGVKNIKSFSYNNFFFKFGICGNFGSFFMFFFSKNLLKMTVSSISQKLLFNLGFVVRKELFQKFFSFLKTAVVGIHFSWMTIFAIEGYHFRTFLHYVKSLKQYAVLFKLGFFYNLLIVFPKSFKIFWKKRLFKLRSSDLLELYNISFYIRMLRNLFPYKVKGIIYDNFNRSKPDYEKQLYRFKQGKKAKLR
jgi:hypothetical protein